MSDPKLQTPKTTIQQDQLLAYVYQHTKEPHPYLATIRQDCQSHKWNFMLTTKDQAAFLFMMARLASAKKILELGCYYGHSTLALASALPPGGKVFSIEHNPKFARAAKEHLQHAGVGGRVEILVGEAPQKLLQLEADHPAGSFDMIFVDADKRHFEDYWESALRLTRPNGLIIFDNVLARGAILDETEETAGHVAAVRAFNAKVAADSRVFSFIATIADGMLVALKI